MRPIARDTTAAATQAQVDALRRMTPEERVTLATRMSDDARALTESGIRQRHPDYSPGEVHDALLGAMLGSDLASHVRRRG